jgi:hypothetical protein
LPFFSGERLRRGADQEEPQWEREELISVHEFAYGPLQHTVAVIVVFAARLGI